MDLGMQVHIQIMFIACIKGCVSDSSIFSEWFLAINTLGKKKDNFLLFVKKKSVNYLL